MTPNIYSLRRRLKLARLRVDHFRRASRTAAVKEAEALVEVERLKAELAAAESAGKRAAS